MVVKKSTQRLGTAPLLPMLMSMAIPGLLGTLTTYLYRTVDQMFVGNFVGRNALGGVSVLSPFNNVIIALTLFITVGGASLLSLSMGKNDYKKADKLFTNIIIQAIGMACIASFIFFVFADSFVSLCGAKEGTQVYKYAVTYLKIVTIGQVFNMLNQGLAAIIRTQGSAKYSMFVNIIGAVFNVILDTLLIVGFHMGIEGAAIATVISQFIGAAFSVAYFLFGKSNLHWIGFRAIEFSQMVYIAKMGVAPSIFQMLSFATNIMLNKSLQYYGDLDPIYSLIGGGELCISAVSIVNTVDNFIVSTTAGINQAASPIISFNYGAKKYERVKKASLLAQLMAFSMALIIWSFMMLAPEFVVNLFSNGDEALVTYAATAMRICKCFALFGGFQMLVSMYFSAIGKPQIATIVSFSRNGVFLIPALYILPQFFGLKGVLYANAVSDGCSLIVVSMMYLYEMRRVGKLEINKEKREETRVKEKHFTQQVCVCAAHANLLCAKSSAEMRKSMNLEKIVSESVLKKEDSRRASRMSLGTDASKLIRMGFNEHPFGMSPKVLHAIKEATGSSNYYGDFMAADLKQEIANFYGLNYENIITGSGSSSLIEVVGTAFLNPGDEVLMCPTFAAFLDMAGIHQATPVIVPLNEDKTYDLDGIYDAITNKTKMIIICNPNNPTGTYVGKKKLVDFIQKVPDDIVILMDEAYIEFATAKDCASMYPLISEMPDKPIVILRTFSKYFAMAGVRVGYALSSPAIINAMSKCPMTMVSKAGQAGAIAALKDLEYYQEAKDKVVEGMTYLEKELDEMGCKIYHSQTNFIMFDPHKDPTELKMEIVNRGVLINTPMLCRVSVGTMEENKIFIEAMKEVMKLVA